MKFNSIYNNIIKVEVKSVLRIFYADSSVCATGRLCLHIAFLSHSLQLPLVLVNFVCSYATAAF